MANPQVVADLDAEDPEAQTMLTSNLNDSFTINVDSGSLVGRISSERGPAEVIIPAPGLSMGSGQIKADVASPLVIINNLISTKGSVVQEGADPTGVNSSTAAFQAALTRVRNAGKGVIEVPTGDYKIDGTDAVLFDMGNETVIWEGDGPLSSILRLQASIPDTTDIFRIRTTLHNVGSGFYGMFITGPAYGTPCGRHALFLDCSYTGAVNSIYQFSMEDCTIYPMKTGNSVKALGDSATQQGGFWGSTFKRNNLNTMYLDFVGDSIRIQDGLLSGPGLGLYGHQGPGSGGILVDFMNMTNTGGLIVFKHVNCPIIQNSILEHGLDTTVTSENNCMIDLRGDATLGPILNPKILNCQIQDWSATHVNPIRIDRATTTWIDGCRITTRTDTYDHIVNTANCEYLTFGLGNEWVQANVNVWEPIFDDNGVVSTYVAPDPYVPLSTYNPTVSSATGTITTYTAEGSFRLIDMKLMYVRGTITITNKGNGAGFMYFSLPPGYTAAKSCALDAVDAGTVFKGSAWINGSAAVIGICKYDGTTIIDNHTYYITGIIELA